MFNSRQLLTHLTYIRLSKEYLQTISDKDKELVKEIEEIILDITKDMESYRFYMAGEKIYQYTWSRFADIIIEESKQIILNGNSEDKISRQQFLLHTLEKILKVLHPFMPFVTEEIWSMMPIENKNLLMVTKWPAYEDVPNID